MRINKRIRAIKVRVIGHDGQQVGILTIAEAQALADQSELDLVEVVPTASPPVCKIIDYGKYRYDQTKREKESKKAQHQVKVKEVKLKPNIDTHDFDHKVRQARSFLEKGNKVKVSCMLRGREMVHAERGFNIIKKLCSLVEDLGAPEAPLKRMGRNLSTVVAPSAKKKV